MANWVLEFQKTGFGGEGRAKSDQTAWSRLSLVDRLYLGNSSTVDLMLEDLPPSVFIELKKEEGEKEGQFSLRVHLPSHQSEVFCCVAGVKIKEGSVGADLLFEIGTTSFRIVQPMQAHASALPPMPPSLAPWWTVCQRGRDFLWNLKQASDLSLSLYLEGETGTGKEVLAHLIHAWSPRSSKSFVPLHCGALPLSLVESELFGHVRGAFTGAISQRSGALLQANGGTLFLDEIGDLPLDIQVKLLRFLENGEIRPIGSDRLVYSDVRVISATHRPLLQLVEEGKFRRDLYYRLASMTFEVPPLRERLEDLIFLARLFAQKFHKTLLPEAVLKLKAHAWPGNVRELRHTIERACGFSSKVMLDEESFSFLNPKGSALQPLLSLKEMEKKMLHQALQLSAGNRTRAAEMLGISRSAVFEMLKRMRSGPGEAS